MIDDSIRGTSIVTAIFDTSAEAERAVARLHAEGIPDSQIRVTAGAGPSYSDSVDTNDSTYRDQHKGFFDSLGDFFFPDEDRYTYAEGLARGAQMVTVTGFDPMLREAIEDILDDEGSIDLDTRESEWRSSGWSGYQGSDYNRDGDNSGTGSMTGGTSGLSGTSAGLGTTIGRTVDRAGDALARGADRLGDALTGDSNQQGFASSGAMGQSMGQSVSGFSGTSGTDRAHGDEDMNDGTLKVVEERLNVGKRDVDMGRIRVRSYVREVPVEAEVDLRATRVHVERRRVDRAASPGDFGTENRVLEAREHAEEAVVAKEARVVEEIGLRQETEVQHERIQDTVRKTEVEIEDERTGNHNGTLDDGNTGSGRF